MGILVEDIFSLARSFRLDSFSHCFCAVNKLTHYLTRLATLSSPLCIWMQEVPLSIIPLVDYDILHSVSS